MESDSDLEGGFVRSEPENLDKSESEFEPEFEPGKESSESHSEDEIDMTQITSDEDLQITKVEVTQPKKRIRKTQSPPETESGDAKPKKPRKRAPKKPKDPTPNVVKTFNRMEQGLQEFHPELRQVFEKLQSQPPTSRKAMDQPPGLLTKLLPFQNEGLGWLVRQEKESIYKGGILADEMGMGKTIQTIALFLSDENERKAPILVIAPTVAVVQWRNEIKQYAGDKLKCLLYHGANRTTDKDEIVNADVVLSTYAVIESVFRKQQSGFQRKGERVYEQSLLHNIEFHRIVLDEAHNIKDRQAGTSRAVFMLNGKYRLCLSGTPLQNRIGELYSLLRFLRVEPFCRYYCTKCDCKSDEWLVERQKCKLCGHVAMQHVNYFNHSLLKHIQRIEGQTDFAMARMRSLLSHIMLRRTKVERADDLGLPPRIVTVRRDFFNEEEKDLYGSVFSDSKRTFSTYVNQGVVLNNYANIFTLITRMRQIADHPDLVLRRRTEEAEVLGYVCKLCDDEAEDAIKSKCNHTFCRMCATEYVQSFQGREQDLVCPVCHVGLTIDLSAPAIEIDQQEYQKSSIINRIQMDDSWRSSTKIEALLEELFRLRSDKQTIKSIVFSQFTSMLDLVEWRLARAGFSTVKLQGSMSPTQRDSIIQHFMETPSVEVFLVSLKAGGVALNLCEASQVFLLDPWWNPSVEWQSGDRVHRIGQHRPVTITRLIIEDSIESRILELQAKKANMINATIGSDDAALNRLSKDDMEFLFQN